MFGANDQFFNIFINTCILFASGMIALINNMVPGKFGINFYMCMGQDPTNYDFLGKKVNILYFDMHIGNCSAPCAIISLGQIF